MCSSGAVVLSSCNDSLQLVYMRNKATGLLFIYLAFYYLCVSGAVQSSIVLTVRLVCLSVRAKTGKLLLRNLCNLLGICVVVNPRCDLISETFELESCFGILTQHPCVSDTDLPCSKCSNGESIISLRWNYVDPPCIQQMPWELKLMAAWL